ncbi:hypothetical protein Acor_71740 [Acrocarpospora corrugata]|uniref:HXXEE domain-containing protein n=1 Tax=Acrocarpospora corrugata TaxID=35763 RepID=A0A5M3W8F1_9ACTN|nr:hypothetical protein Acor_71740 [Acrocarpospora corrugata]
MAVLFLYHFVLGVWPLLLARSFYDSFPLPGHSWVALLPPYNEHLLRDFGGLNLAMVVVVGAAAVFMERRIVLTALVADIVAGVPHMIFHVLHLQHFPPVDAISQSIALAVVTAIPIILLVPAWQLPRQRRS